MLAESVKLQSRQIFQNIDILFDSIPEHQFSSIKGGFKTWKHFYHLIHSIDKNFIDPSSFNEPELHIENLDIMYFEDNNALSKVKIYLAQIRHI